MIAYLCHFRGLLFARQMLDNRYAATRCNVLHSPQGAYRSIMVVMGALAEMCGQTLQNWLIALGLICRGAERFPRMLYREM